jgi:hypothetical protein
MVNTNNGVLLSRARPELGDVMNSKFGFSKLRSAVGIGAASLIVLAGVAIVGVGAASALDTLIFSPVPPTTSTAGTVLSSFTVTGGTSTATMTITSSCTLTGTTTGTVNGSGDAAFNAVTIDTAGSCTLTATESAGGTGTVTSAAITVSPAAANKLGFNVAPPATAGAGVALTTFKVATEDQYGNVIAGATNTVAIASSCTLGGTTSVAEVAGVASFSALSINQVGSCILIASSTGLTSASSAAIAVSGGTPAKVAFSVAPPASVLTTGTAVTTFKVSVEDASGNVDTTGTGSTDLITVSSPCLAASVAATASAGVATFSTVEFATTGDCVLTATDSSRAIAAATATTVVGAAQPALTITTKSGYLDAPVTLVTAGGAGTGAVTYTVTNGTATVCAVSTAGVLTAKTGGTCIVTAYKAAATTYAPATSVATTVTISSAPKAVRLVGAVWNARKTTVTVSGYNFSGRPRIASNVAGFKATVSRDSGKSLTIVVSVTGSASRPGVKVMTIKFANGKTTSVRYSLH